MRLVALLLALILEVNAFAQGMQGGMYFAANGDLVINMPQSYIKKRETQLESPLLYEAGKKGLILFSGNKSFPFTQGYFNVETNLLEAIKDGKKQYYDPNIIEGFGFVSNDSLINLFIRVENPENNNKLVFMEVLSLGKLNLLLQRKFAYKKGDYNAGLASGNPDTFGTSLKYFTFIKGEKLLALNKNKNRILPLFENNSENVRSFADKLGYKFSNIPDLIEIFDYYNSLK